MESAIERNLGCRLQQHHCFRLRPGRPGGVQSGAGHAGIDGRKVMCKRFRDDILTLTLPMPLFQRMEREADDCVFYTPSWKDLIGR